MKGLTKLPFKQCVHAVPPVALATGVSGVIPVRQVLDRLSGDMYGSL